MISRPSLSSCPTPSPARRPFPSKATHTLRLPLLTSPPPSPSVPSSSHFLAPATRHLPRPCLARSERNPQRHGQTPGLGWTWEKGSQLEVGCVETRRRWDEQGRWPKRKRDSMAATQQRSDQLHAWLLGQSDRPKLRVMRWMERDAHVEIGQRAEGRKKGERQARREDRRDQRERENQTVRTKRQDETGQEERNLHGPQPRGGSRSPSALP